MQHFCDEWIEEWCQDNGWTDLFRERYNNYWAFPPNAVMPEPIPFKTLQIIKAKKGLCPEEKLWLMLAWMAGAMGLLLSILMQNPMPLVLAFAFDAIAIAQFEVEEFSA
ncbi:MAG: hypothetical protein ACKOX2_14130 [Microcystaceae cyanobacterium]